MEAEAGGSFLSLKPTWSGFPLFSFVALWKVFFQVFLIISLQEAKLKATALQRTASKTWESSSVSFPKGQHKKKIVPKKW